MLRHRFEVQKLCEDYEPAMRDFAVEQIRNGRINADLAYIYEQVLPPDVISPDLIRDFVRLLFTCDVRIDDPDVKKICVIQEEITGERIYPVDN